MTCDNHGCHLPAESSRVLEKVDPHSCSTSRSDSPQESSERKKKHKRKDKEKREKVRNFVKCPLIIYVCFPRDTQFSCLLCLEESGNLCF